MKNIISIVIPLYVACLLLLWWQRWSVNAFVVMAGFLLVIVLSAILSRLLMKTYWSWTLPIMIGMFLVFAIGAQILITVGGVSASITEKTAPYLSDHVYMTLDSPIQNVVIIVLVYAVVHWRVLPRRPKTDRLMTAHEIRKEIQ